MIDRRGDVDVDEVSIPAMTVRRSAWVGCLARLSLLRVSASAVRVGGEDRDWRTVEGGLADRAGHLLPQVELITTSR